MLKALIAIAENADYNFELLKNVESINKEATKGIVTKAQTLLEDVKGKKIAILGLSFKPDTDDMRDAPSLIIIRDLVAQGAHIQAFDPVAQENAKRLLKDVEHVTFMKNADEAVTGADAVILVTERYEVFDEVCPYKSGCTGN